MTPPTAPISSVTRRRLNRMFRVPGGDRLGDALLGALDESLSVVVPGISSNSTQEGLGFIAPCDMHISGLAVIPHAAQEASPDKAALTTDAVDANARLTITAKDAGEAGNDITFAILAAATISGGFYDGTPVASQVLDVTVPQDEDIVVTPGTTAGTAATLTTTAAAGVNGRVALHAKYPGSLGNSVHIVLNDPGSNAALAVTSIVGGVITIRLGYSGGAIDTTAAALKAFLDADVGVQALLTTTTLPGTGASLVSAQVDTPLATGANPTESTASAVKTKIEATTAADDLVDVTLPGTGAAAVTTFAATNLAGGGGEQTTWSLTVDDVVVASVGFTEDGARGVLQEGTGSETLILAGSEVIVLQDSGASSAQVAANLLVAYKRVMPDPVGSPIP